MSSKIAKAILTIQPEAKFVVRGSLEDYTIEWHSPGIAEPTRDQITSALVDLAALDYREKRANEYPSIGDQLDALFHAGVFPPEMAERIKAVKNKYPKS